MYSESRDNKPPTIVEEDETPKRNRPPDLQGFTILDERWKSCSDDSDDSLPASGSYISSPSAGRFCKSVDFRTLQRNTTASSTPPAPVTQPSTPTLKNPPSRSSLSSTMASGGSRFKIVPVETRYKRNRWSCYDYYDHRDPFFTRVTKHSHQTPAAALKKEEIVNRSSRSLSDIHPVPAVAATPPAAPIKPQAAPTNLPKPVYVAPRASLPPAPTKVANNSHTFTNGSHAQTIAKNAIKASNENSESLNGLQTSLTNEPEQRRVKRSPFVRAKSVVTASPPAHQLNIDSKIEQAMDLVKTHLMFAVREEVDGLKGKISELENHVNRLEAENSILKKTLPNDVLQKLHLKL